MKEQGRTEEAVGALFYTAQGLAQSQAATSKQNELALQQNQLAQSGQITDRFNAAVTNLGSQVITIRIGGIKQNNVFCTLLGHMGKHVFDKVSVRINHTESITICNVLA